MSKSLPLNFIKKFKSEVGEMQYKISMDENKHIVGAKKLGFPT